MPVSSLSLSETQRVGGPRSATRASSSRTTRRPESELSAMRHRHSRAKSSTMVRIRKRLFSPTASLTTQRPALVGSLRDRHQHPAAEHALAVTAPGHLETSLALEPAQLLVIDAQPLPPAAISAPNCGRRQSPGTPTAGWKRAPFAEAGVARLRSNCGDSEGFNSSFQIQLDYNVSAINN